MGEAFVSDEEYPTYFVTLEGMREAVAAELGPLAGEVLDVATGSAYFAMALAGKHPDIHVTAIDIHGLETARENVDERRLTDRITLREMDATSRNEVEVFSWICDATWLTGAEYMGLVSDSGVAFEYSKVFRTGRKLTVEQAKEEIGYACENVPAIYGRPARGFDEAWERFGDSIMVHGMGHYSRLELFVTWNN